MLAHKHSPRLFLCGYQSGEITGLYDVHPTAMFKCYIFPYLATVEELINFSQKDLSPELVLVLDAGHALYEWIGNYAHKEDQKLSIQLAKDFLKIGEYLLRHSFVFRSQKLLLTWSEQKRTFL